MSMIILNAKVSPLLKEAIRIVAFSKDGSNSSATVVRILADDPDVKRELRKLQQRSKNKVA